MKISSLVPVSISMVLSLYAAAPAPQSQGKAAKPSHGPRVAAGSVCHTGHAMKGECRGGDPRTCWLNFTTDIKTPPPQGHDQDADCEIHMHRRSGSKDGDQLMLWDTASFAVDLTPTASNNPKCPTTWEDVFPDANGPTMKKLPRQIAKRYKQDEAPTLGSGVPSQAAADYKCHYQMKDKNGDGDPHIFVDQ